MNNNNNNKTYRMILCALMAALLCILSPISIPIGPVPISLQIFVVCLTAFILGRKLGTVSIAIFLALGAAGIPVFSGYTGGFSKLIGPTGGYLIGFLPDAYISGLIIEKSNRRIFMSGFGMFTGVVLCYAIGTAWFMFQSGTDLMKALSLCVISFIPFDLLKIVTALLLGKPVYKALQRSGLSPGDNQSAD